MDSITIRQIIDQTEAGQIRIPAFQRGFVWEPERVAQFIDSLYKGYPFGALLFWRTAEKLNSERNLGPFTLPDPKADYPIDYVLDGQQRLTSVYATFQTSQENNPDQEWKDIYFDFSLADDVQEPQFFALSDDEVEESKHFPIRVIYDTVMYRKATKNLSDALATRIDGMQSKFKEALLPVQAFRTEDKATVAVIFERINRLGVPLNTLQLLAAWTWSEEFQLQRQFEELMEELDARGFETGVLDENLLLRCAAAVLVASPRPEDIVKITGEQVRARFDEVVNGVLGALDFLQANLNVRRIDNIPFQTILVPLSVFFAISGNKQIHITADQRVRLTSWFWRVSFSRRYSSGVIRHLEDDLKAMLQLKGGQQSNLGSFNVEVLPSFFIVNAFNIHSVNTKSFILMLSQNGPRSFISGAPVNLDAKLKEYNNAEFHHMMPKAFAKSVGANEILINCLANRCFLSRSENRELGGVAPSLYRAKMPEDIGGILESAFTSEVLFEDDVEKFVKLRAGLLAEKASQLVA